MNLENDQGHFALSLPIDIPDERKRKINLFYSPSKEGALEILARVQADPLNPNISNLRWCFASVSEQLYS